MLVHVHPEERRHVKHRRRAHQHSRRESLLARVDIWACCCLAFVPSCLVVETIERAQIVQRVVLLRCHPEPS